MSEDRTSRRPGGPRWGLAAVGVAVIGLVAMLFAPSGALTPPGGLTTTTDIGGVDYVGMIGMPTRPVTLLKVWPRTDAPAEVLLCRPVPGADPFYYLPGESIGDHCAQLEPVTWGTDLEPNRPAGDADGYVVVRVDTAGFDTVAFCGLRVLFRTGLRIVYDGDVGPSHVVWNPPVDGPGESYEPCEE